MSDLPLKNFREVGSFDLLSPPLTPIGLVDGQALGSHIKELVESGSQHIVLDCSGLDFLYSDTLTILAQAHQVLEHKNGTLGILSMSESIVDSVNKSALADLMTVYPVETDLIQASMKLMSGQKPEVQSGTHQHDHDLEVVEAHNNEGFESINSPSNAAASTSSKLSQQAPAASKAPATQEASSDLDISQNQESTAEPEAEIKPHQPKSVERHDQTAEIQVLSQSEDSQEVQEEQFTNPKELAQEMDKAPEGVKVAVAKKSSSQVIWLLILILLIAALAAAWHFKVIKI